MAARHFSLRSVKEFIGQVCSRARGKTGCTMEAGPAPAPRSPFLRSRFEHRTWLEGCHLSGAQHGIQRGKLAEKNGQRCLTDAAHSCSAVLRLLRDERTSPSKQHSNELASGFPLLAFLQPHALCHLSGALQERHQVLVVLTHELFRGLVIETPFLSAWGTWQKRNETVQAKDPQPAGHSHLAGSSHQSPQGPLRLSSQTEKGRGHTLTMTAGFRGTGSLSSSGSNCSK